MRHRLIELNNRFGNPQTLRAIYRLYRELQPDIVRSIFCSLYWLWRWPAAPPLLFPGVRDNLLISRLCRS